MKAVIMAGGEGSRLRPITIGRPKPLVPIVNKPVMAHTFDLLKKHGITEVIITLRYMASLIQDFFEDGSSIGMKISYSVEEIPLGTAGSVKNAAQFIDSPFLVLSSDALTDFNLSAILADHKEAGMLATLTLTAVPDPLEYGLIMLNEERRITQILEKPGWGEVISDTVNTGIYIFEPEVLDLIPEKVPYDFSNDLFPEMLKKNVPIHGHVAQGYWCDVGNIGEYRKANADLLNGELNLADPIGDHIGGNIWVGKDVDIAPDAQLYGPIYLGNHVRIKRDVVIHGPTVIRDSTIVDNHSRIERSIIWRNCYIGESCELRGTVVGRQCSIRSRAMLYEGSVIGDGNVLGEQCAIHPNIKLWPNKEIDAGAVIKESIVWANQGRRTLFSSAGVTGIVNMDLTPEFAAKLAAALGAEVEKGSFVAANRDTHRSSRMIKRAMISGLPGVGVNVLDTSTLAIPVLCHFVRSRDDISAGIHIRLSPFDQRVVDIRFIDSNGMSLRQSTERKIERNFFREDFRRAYLDDIGIIEYPPVAIDTYESDLLDHINIEHVHKAGLKLVLDYSHGLAVEVLASILNQLGVEVVPLNARVDETKLAILEDKFRANMSQVSKIVIAVDANVGVQLDVGGEQIFIVDELGRMLDDITAASLMIELALSVDSGSIVAVPITAPNAFDRIAARHDSMVIRTENKLHALLDDEKLANVLMRVDGDGHFIFPKFQPVIDSIMATVKLLHYMTHQSRPLSQIIDELPPVYMTRTALSCSAEFRGRAMRLLRAESEGLHLEQVNGLKIHLGDNEWVHVVPNPDKPILRLTSEGNSQDRADEIMSRYREMLEGYIAI